MNLLFLVITINKKAQTWSVDIILGILVFMGAFIIFYAVLNQSPNTKVKNLKQEASIVIKQVSSDDTQLRIIDQNELNISRAGELKNLSYEELQKRLRIEGDFCIYIEDENGNVILINNSYRGIGSPDINITGIPCSQK